MMDKDKAVVIDFLRRCVQYSDESIQRKKGRGDLEEIPKWQAYRDFTDYAIKEIEEGKLDDWFSTPPPQTKGPLKELKISKLEHQDRVKIIDGLIGPRPIFVAATCSDDGIHNLGLLSTVAPASNSPALLTCSLSQDRDARPRDTLVNLKQNGNITLHLLPTSIEGVRIAEAAAEILPSNESEWELFDAEPPNLPGAIASIHCRLVDQHSLPKGAVATLCVLAIESISLPEELQDELLKGGNPNNLYQHGWCNIHPSDADWSHLIR